MAITHNTATDIEVLEKPVDEVLVTGGRTYAEVNEDVSRPLEAFPTAKWWICFCFAITAFGMGATLLLKTFAVGIGVWGLNQPMGWGTDITTFVFWLAFGAGGGGALYC